MVMLMIMTMIMVSLALAVAQLLEDRGFNAHGALRLKGGMGNMIPP